MRGAYLIEAARIEDRGIPIDVSRLEAIRARRDELLRYLIGEHPDIDVYDGVKFNQKKFQAFVTALGLAKSWRKTETGFFSAQSEYLELMGESFPVIEDFRQLKKVVLQLQRDRFRAGADGRSRTPLWPFSSITSRNQPSAGQKPEKGVRSECTFVFGLPKALRFLMKPESGTALAYLDWVQQEFAVAAFMSHDPEMIAAYRSGDCYLALAKKLGAVPMSATKESHPRERDKFKIVVLSVNYGRTKHGLAKVLDLPVAECAKLLRGYWEVFSVYARWRVMVRTQMLGFGRLWTFDNWQTLLGTDPNIRSILNWPVQSGGAVLLRLAILMAAKRGVVIIAPVHDAVLIEARESEIQEHVRIAVGAMNDACQLVLGDVIRTEFQIIHDGQRYFDENGKKLWSVICKFMEWSEL
jgi:DNA polymerase-1